MHLNLKTDRPEQYEGRLIELNGVSYHIGRRLEHGRDWQSHLLINLRSQVAMHQIQLPKPPPPRESVVRLSMPPPRAVRGCIKLGGGVVLHPLSQHEDLDADTAEAWTRIHPPDEAQQCQELLSKHPQHAPTLLRLAHLARDRSQALKLAAETLAVEPHWLPAQLLHWSCCLAEGRPRQAVNAYQRMVNLFPTEAPHPEVVPMFLATGDVDSARHVLDLLSPAERTDLEPRVEHEAAATERAKPFLTAAKAALMDGNDELALASMQAAWRENANAAWLRFNLSLACWRAGRPHLAWSLMKPALFLVPVSFLPLLGLHLAAIAIELGWLAEAVTLLEGCGLPGPMGRLRWYDDEQGLIEPDLRGIHMRLQELASAASRLGMAVRPPLRQLMGHYQISVRPSQFLASEYQVEKVVDPRVVVARNAVTGARCILRFGPPDEAPPRWPRHPNVLAPRYRRRAGTMSALVYEFPGGGTVAEQIASGRLWLGAQAPRKLVTVALQMAHALAVCHREDCCHGALDLQHVLVSDDGQPRIVFPPTRPETASIAGDVAAFHACLRALYAGPVPRPEALQSPGTLSDAIGALETIYSELCGEPFTARGLTGPPMRLAEDALDRADDSLGEADFTAALLALEGVEESARGCAIRSVSKRWLGHDDEARAQADRALALAATPAEFLAAHDALAPFQTSQDALQSARDTLRQASEDPATRAAALLREAVLYFEAGEGTRVVDVCGELHAVADAPVSILALADMLQASMVGDAEAIGPLRSLAVADNRIESWLLVSRILTRGAVQAHSLETALQFHAQAWDVLRSVVLERGLSAAAPSLADALLETGLLLTRLQATQAAVRHLHVAILLWRNMTERPGSPPAWERLAQALVAMARALALDGCIDMAMSTLKEARDIYAQQPVSTWASTGFTLAEVTVQRASGRLEAAASQARSILQADDVPLDRQAETWVELADIDNDADALQRAITCWEALGTRRGQREADALRARLPAEIASPEAGSGG